ncbi:MAG: tetratricopeptide repeat protein [Planctomycetota bacterium]
MSLSSLLTKLTLPAVTGAAVTADAATLIQLDQCPGLAIGAGVVGAAIAGVQIFSSERQGHKLQALRSDVDRLIEQGGEWRQGLDEILIRHGLDLSSLPKEALNNPLAKFALLLKGNKDEIEALLRKDRDLHFALHNAMASRVDDIRRSLDLSFEQIQNYLHDIHHEILAVQREVAELQPFLGTLYNELQPHPRLELPRPTWTPSLPRGNPFVFSDRRVPLFGREQEMSELFERFLLAKTDADADVMWWLWTGAAGLGKSRLAYELCFQARLKGWDAGFLKSRTHFSDWASWRPKADTLIVIDYAGERPRRVGEAIAGVYDNLTEQHRVRFLLLERAQDGSWLQKMRDVGNAVYGTEHIMSTRELGPITQDALWDTMLTVFADRGCEPPDRDQALARLRQVDPEPRNLHTQAEASGWQPRPLYAAVLADAIADLGFDRVDDWSGHQLLLHVLKEEHKHWEKLRCPTSQQAMEDRHVHSLSLATMVRKVTFSPPAPPEGFETVRDLLPAGEPGDTYLLEHIARFAGPSRDGDTEPLIKNQTPPVTALQPDILGELFVLERLRGEFVLGGDGGIVADATRRLFYAAWEKDAEATDDFILRAVGDFPHHPAIDLLWRRCGDQEEERRRWAATVAKIIPVLMARGRIDEAFKLMNDLGQLHQASPHDPELAGPFTDTLNRLGLALKNMAHFDRAIAMYHQALDIDRRVFGNDHPNVAVSVNNIGGVLKARGDLDGALEAFRDAERIDRAAFGDDHPNVAIRVNNIGSVLKARGDLDEALEAYRGAERIDREALGNDHPNVAVSVNNIGSVLEARGDLDGALEAFRDAERIDRVAFGNDHPKVAIRVNNIGSVLSARGDLDGALEAFRDAERINRAAFGNDHPNVAVCVNNIGSIFFQGSEKAEAAECARQAFDIMLRYYGPRAAETIQYGLNLWAVEINPVQEAQRIVGDEVAAELAVAIRDALRQMKPGPAGE